MNLEEFVEGVNFFDSEQVKQKSVDEIVKDVYLEYAAKESVKPNQPTSFYASQFPDGYEGCKRKLIYSICGFFSDRKFRPQSIGVMQSGKDVEDRVVEKFAESGILLSADPRKSSKQTKFYDADLYMSGAVDAIILPKGSNRPHVVEIKSKSEEHIGMLRNGGKQPDSQHIAQLKAYISIFSERSKELWPEYDQIISGSLLYVSRENPSNCVSFAYPKDDEFFKKGSNILKECVDNIRRNSIPARDSSYMWSVGPCKYCNYKKEVCKKDGIVTISESNGIEYSKANDKEFDLFDRLQKVKDRNEKAMIMKSSDKYLTEITLNIGLTITTDSPYTTVRKLVRGFADSHKAIKGNVNEYAKPCFLEVNYFDEKTGNFDKKITINTDSVAFVNQIDRDSSILSVIETEVAQVKKEKRTATRKASKKNPEETKEQNEGQTQISIPVVDEKKIAKGGVVESAVPTVIEKEDLNNLERFSI